MVKKCANCENSKWKDGTTLISDICFDCNYVDEDGCKQPSNWKPKTQTNADRIRAMSDEELSEHLYKIGWGCYLCSERIQLKNRPVLLRENCDFACKKHCLEWLRQPVEDMK